ncbi:MAG: hypothetical protein M3P29_07780 [Acidobacteriota bacterium]|nr:hypothetical protein [Acidobacteriota bacterium]
MVPLVAFVLFGLYVRREAERIRAADGKEVVRGRMKDVAGRPHVIIRLKLAGKGMATREELHLRQAIEDEIEQRGIGAIADAGSGKGWAHVHVVVADPGEAAAQIREVLRERGVLDTSIVEGSTAGPR